MMSDVMMKKKLERKEIVKELENIHTSLISKKLQDAQENFKLS